MCEVHPSIFRTEIVEHEVISTKKYLLIYLVIFVYAILLRLT